MFDDKPSIDSLLIDYILKMDNSEKKQLLEALNKRKIIGEAKRLSEKGRRMKKQKMKMKEITDIIKEIRKTNAGKAT